RCRVDAEWPRHEQEFNKKVEQILADAPRTTIDGVKAYFADNWWCTTWRDLSTDIGLCAGQTRDGLNTNNTIERAFKTFDQVFLACRVNKRIDRLVPILATDWLVYYEHYASQVSRVGKVERDMMLKAHQLWESHAVVCISKKHARYRIIGVSSKRSKHKGERRRSKKSKKSKHRHKQRARDSTETASKRDLPPSNDQVVSLEHANVGCTCSLWIQTGKYCEHLHAARIFSIMGDVQHSMALEQSDQTTSKASGMAQFRSAMRRQDHGDMNQRAFADHVIDEEVDRLLGLRKLEEAEMEEHEESTDGAERRDSGLQHQRDASREPPRTRSSPVRPATVRPSRSKEEEEQDTRSQRESDALRESLSTKPSPGRPATVKPLHPGRSSGKRKTRPDTPPRSSSALRFSKKRGPGKESLKLSPADWDLLHVARSPESNSKDQDQGEGHSQTSERLGLDTLEGFIEKSFSRGRETLLQVQVSAAHSRLHLFKDDFECMRTNAWLTGTIITLFVQHIQHQIQSRARLVAGTWLYEPEDSCDDQRLLKKITSWRENEMISTCKRIVFPLNLNNCHWAVGIVDVGTRSIRIVDSMPSQVHHTSFCNFLARFMNGRLAWELERAGQDGTAARARRWITTPQDPVIDTILPRQNDGSSCGLIACKAIEAVLRNKPPTWKSCGLKAQNISLDEANHMRQALFNMTQLYIKPRGL
ncbi:hypothetical protein A4X06_0g8704, partial [Tilletia controversa]